MLITFEGIEGSGKSTQAKALYNWLMSKGFNCVLTKEPGATYLGKILRRLLLIPQREEITKEAELFLYLADRSQHVELFIKPSIEQGKVVIIDRFIDSTIAYQGYGRGFSINLLTSLNELVLKGLKPNITFLLDLDPKEGLRRVDKRNKQGGISSKEIRFEQETISFHNRVRTGYLELQKKFPDRIILLDARKDPNEIFNEVLSVVKKKLKV